ncbi:hypothetical protein [Metabacillus sp. 84]|uniref:hypothetical protein n=1 Tax=unclassified Metabacillus TaxID=2675274 RepID=UPI003CEF57B0
MDTNLLFVKNYKEFFELKKMVTDTFLIENNLPYKVFQPQFSSFLFEEFDWCMSNEFWKTIRKIADITDESYIISAVLDPDPIEYFFKEFNYYNWIKIPKDLPDDSYEETLELGPKESPADAILYNSFTIVWLSPSKKWGIWGDREYGVSVMGFQNEEVKKSLMPFLYSWRSLDETVLSRIGINFRNQKTHQEFGEILKLNYS